MTTRDFDPATLDVASPEHYERNGHLEYVHSVTGVRTLKDELEKVASHNEHHLGQIRTALGSGVVSARRNP